MTTYLSQKLKILSFASIILVLYIHSGFHDYPNEIQGMTFNFKLQEFISGMVGRCAVPLFFMISGYLFFIGLGRNNKPDYHKLWMKIRKRGRTLLVPYLIGCLFPIAFYFVLDHTPVCKKFLNVGGGEISEAFQQSIHEIIRFIYFDSGSGTPFAFHLWFLRDLIIIIILSPVLLAVSKWIGIYITCIILFLMNYFDIPLLPIYGMFWFMFGACCLERLSNIQSIFIPMAFLLLCIVEMAYPSGYWEYARIPVIMLGVTSIWTIYDRLCPPSFNLNGHPLLMKSCGYTFFIYLFHEPTLNVVRKTLVLPFHHSSFGFALSYLASPWLFAMIWIVVGMIFKKVLPAVYNICTGGR